MNTRKYIHLFVFLLLIISCKKDDDSKDVEQIKWNVSSPDVQSVFEIPAEIEVRASVESPVNIESITVEVYSFEGRKVGNALLYQPKSRTFSIDTTLRITDQTINTGTHYLSFIARTSGGSKEEFRLIQIVAEPLTLKGVFLASGNLLYEVDSTGVNEVLNPGMEIYRLHHYPLSDHMLVIDSSGELLGYDLSARQEKWRKKLSDFSFKPILKTSYFEYGDLYYCDVEGNIFGIDQNNQIIYNSISQFGYLCRNMTRSDDLFFSVQKSRFSKSHLLVQNSHPSGSFYQENSSVGKVDFLFPSVKGEIILVQTKGEKGEVRRFDEEKNAYIYGTISFDEPISQAIQLDERTIVLVSGQDIYRVDVIDDGRLKLGTIRNPDNKLYYERAGGTIWEVDNKDIYIYSLNKSNQNPVGVSYDIPIQELLFRYNK